MKRFLYPAMFVISAIACLLFSAAPSLSQQLSHPVNLHSQQPVQTVVQTHRTAQSAGSFSQTEQPVNPPHGPRTLANPNGDDRQGLLETECQWTNGNYAECLVYDCDDDGVCVEYGDYCVDQNGRVMPCP